jgi:hypothetical protein
MTDYRPPNPVSFKVVGTDSVKENALSSEIQKAPSKKKETLNRSLDARPESMSWIDRFRYSHHIRFINNTREELEIYVSFVHDTKLLYDIEMKGYESASGSIAAPRDSISTQSRSLADTNPQQERQSYKKLVAFTLNSTEKSSDPSHSVMLDVPRKSEGAYYVWWVRTRGERMFCGRGYVSRGFNCGFYGLGCAAQMLSHIG